MKHAFFQECQARVSSKNVKLECPVKVSSKSVKQECQARVSRESVKKDCLAKCVKKECLDGWGGASGALVDDSASHLRKQERFECYASIQSDCIRVRGFYQVFDRFLAYLILSHACFSSLILFGLILSVYLLSCSWSKFLEDPVYLTYLILAIDPVYRLYLIYLFLI